MNALLYTPATDTPRALAIGLTVLRYLMAAFFLFMAGKNLAGDAHMASEFRRWGYSDGFRMFTAFLQIAGAVLLVSPRFTFLGCGVLTVVLIGAAVTHLRHDPPLTVAAPLVFMVLVGALQWGYRPPLLR